MNKLIKMVVIVAGVGAMLGFAGCGANNNPGEIAEDFFNAALEGKDMESYVKKYGTEDAIQRMNKDMKSFTEAFAEMKNIKKKVASECPLIDNLKIKFVAKDVKIDGETAKVDLRILISGKNKLTGETSEDVQPFDDIEFKRVNGAWKLGM